MKKFLSCLVAAMFLASTCFAGTATNIGGGIWVNGVNYNMDWAAGNVTYVPLGANIETYIAAATAGDTLVLASGTYTITDDIDVTKAINIVGQGVGQTIINCATASKKVFDISVTGVRISDLSITTSGGTDNAIYCVPSGQLASIIVENVKITSSGAGSNYAMYLSDVSGTIRNCEMVVTSSDGLTRGLYYQNTSASSGASILDVFSSKITVTSGGSTGGRAISVANGNVAQTVTCNLYDSHAIANAGGTADYGIYVFSNTTNNAYFNSYFSTISGQDYDVVRAGTNTLTLYGTTLVNGTTSGTISYVNGNSIAKSGNIYYSYVGEDLDALIASSKITAGDTIVLGAGTYTITDDIDVTKAVNIVGQGIGQTTIACATADKIAFDTSADNVRISNLTISSSQANTVATPLVRFSGSGEIERVSFLNAATGASNIGADNILLTAAKTVNVRNCSFTSTGAIGYHLAVEVSTAGATANIYDCYATESGGTSATLSNILVFTGNATSTINLYGGSFSSTSNSTGGAIQCTSGTLTVKNTAISSTGTGSFDVKQVAGTLTLYDCTLVNGTTSGTITYDGTVVSEDGYFSDSVTVGKVNFGADAQASDTYVITLSPAPTAYTTGMTVVFTATTANTGACTLNVNALGAKALKSLHDQDPADGYIEAGSVVTAVYDGTNFQIQNPDANP